MALSISNKEENKNIIKNDCDTELVKSIEDDLNKSDLELKNINFLKKFSDEYNESLKEKLEYEHYGYSESIIQLTTFFNKFIDSSSEIEDTDKRIIKGYNNSIQNIFQSYIRKKNEFKSDNVKPFKRVQTLNVEQMNQLTRINISSKIEDSKSEEKQFYKEKYIGILINLSEKYCNGSDPDCIQNALITTVHNFDRSSKEKNAYKWMNFGLTDFENWNLGPIGIVTYTENGVKKQFRFDERYKDAFKNFIMYLRKQKPPQIWPGGVLKWDIFINKKHDDKFTVKFIIDIEELDKFCNK